MKKNLLIILLFVSALVKAQTSGGPDAYGYTWRNDQDAQGPIYNWIDITGRPGVQTVVGLQDDNLRGPFSFSIPFIYYWYHPTKFWIGSNGYIGFTQNGVAAPFPYIPSLALPNDWMAVMASDLTLTDINVAPIPNTMVQYWSNNVDTLIVSWVNVPFWDQFAPGYTGSNTFQVILSCADSSITYQYKDQQGTYNANPLDFMEVGIENNSGSICLEINHDTYPLMNTAIKFYYPDTVTFAINDASTFNVNNPGTHGQILMKNSSVFTSTAAVKNTGNQTLPSFNSYSRVVNTANAIQVRDTMTVTGLQPAATLQLTYPDQWSPTIAGTFRQINQTILTGDATPSNNTDTLEIMVIDPTLASITLAWDNGTSSGPGLAWLGGGGGIAQHFVPPFYPATITAMGCLVISDLNLYGFSLQIYDDAGPGGLPTTQLDSIFVTGGDYTQGVYYETPTTSAITINSGGFYVAWMMGGDQVTLAQDMNTPHSNQSWEILGPANAAVDWSPYRSAALYDPVIHAVISGTTDTHGPSADVNHFGEFYPNPANFKSSLQYNLDKASDVKFALYTSDGKLVAEKSLGKVDSGDNAIQINLQNYAAGSYICKITAGNKEYHKKINIVR